MFTGEWHHFLGATSIMPVNRQHWFLLLLLLEDFPINNLAWYGEKRYRSVLVSY